MAPLYKLMEKDHKWLWSAEYHNTFMKCKELFTCKAVLAHYDSAKPIKLACGASGYGLGIVLLHTLNDGEHPMAFALVNVKFCRTTDKLNFEGLIFVLLK